jgi:predicted nucleic acid-binding protein
MMKTVILDAAPVGILCHPRNPPHVVACSTWVTQLLAAGHRLILPEIADYECRREFELNQETVSLSHLDVLGVRLEFLQLTSLMWRHAAKLWGDIRRAGRPTADRHALDADVILAAQALSLGTPVIVATSNPGHLGRFVPADLWQNIQP